MRKGVRRALIAAAIAAAVGAAMIACTLQVGQPTIILDCVVVEFQTEKVMYCDGKYVPTSPPPSDGGHAG